MNYFDHVSVAHEAGLKSEELDALSTRVRTEFPADEMMYELHLLRACMAIRDGLITLEEALRIEPAGQI